MKIEPEDIKRVKQEFASIRTKQDLLELINLAKDVYYGEKTIPIDIKSINYYSNPEICKKRYTSFSVRKKNGGERLINSPVKGLKSILKIMNFIFQCIHEPHKAATGFVRNKSIVDNAKIHINKRFVYNIDIKDFFHSFDRNRVKLAFMNKPFNLRGELEPLAFIISSMCTHPFLVNGEMKTVLPQGSPTSPTITNIICQNLDRRLNGLSKRFNMNYSRYADDITFSSNVNNFNDEDFQKELNRIIEEDQNLILNKNKTRLQGHFYRQEVTGLVVNEKVNLRRRYIKQIRMWIYYWEKYGFEKAEEIFKRDYLADKGYVKKGIPNFINVLDGKLEYCKMVKGMNDSTYQKLKKRFDKLQSQSNEVKSILDLWDKEGIEKAIETYGNLITQ
ncbi:reverse transcriptase family protein [Maribellus mangrovi]|uniref:reverse transcriptase family protein n=1 Tax=Maribellus mangrovi TaxID=3133146 RepID=UPI0030EB9AF3